MTDIADVLVAVANTVKAGMPSTDALSSRTYPFAPDDMFTPFAVALPASGDFLAYDTTFDGSDDMAVMLKVIVGAEFSRTAQNQLLTYMDKTGSLSIRAVIAAAPTLGGVVSSTDVTGWQNYGDVEWAGVVYFGAEMLATVLT